jgi:hypothetical protein
MKNNPVHVGFFARNNTIDRAFAGDIFNLSATEIELPGKFGGLAVLQSRND